MNLWVHVYWGQNKSRKKIIFTAALRMSFLSCQKPCLAYLCLFIPEHSGFNWEMTNKCHMDLLNLSGCIKGAELQSNDWLLAHSRRTGEFTISLVLDSGFILGSPGKLKEPFSPKSRMYERQNISSSEASYIILTRMLRNMIYLVNYVNQANSGIFKARYILKFRYILSSNL